MSPKKQSRISRKAATKDSGADVQPASSGAPIPPEGVGNVDQIRDILFGTQMRDYERRFTRLEERMSKEVAQLREDTRKHFDALESYTRGEIESLSERLCAEQKDRASRDEQLGDALEELLKAFEARAAELDEKLTRAARDLRQQLLAQSKSLSDEIQSRHNELSASLEREADDLRSTKVDRAKLSEILSQVALLLTNEQAFNLGLRTGDSDDE